MKFFPLSAFILVIMVLTGCGYKGVYPCFDASFQMYFSKFSDAEIDTIVIRKYKPGDSYQHLVDSVIISGSNAIYNRKGDTIRIYNPDSIGIKARFDWQIEIPSVGKTVNISDIVSSDEAYRCPSIARDCGCINTVHSMRVDHILVVNPGQYPGDHALYISR